MIFKIYFTVWNTHSKAVVVIAVKDVNDNSPLFVYPPYPRQNQDTAKKYFGAIPYNAQPDRPVLQVSVRTC